MKFLKILQKYRLELISFLDIEVFLWSITRRYFEKPPSRTVELMLNVAIMISGIALIPLTLRLTKKWREVTRERVREVSRRILRRLSERVLRWLEQHQFRRGRGQHDLMGGSTYMEYDLFGGEHRKKKKRLSWKQLTSERERIRWLYADMVRTRIRQGDLIRPSETPTQVGAHRDLTPAQAELIARYTDCRYDLRHEPEDGHAERLRDT